MIRIFGIRPKYIPSVELNADDDEDNFLEDLKGALEGEADDDDEFDDSSKGGIVTAQDNDAFFIDYEEPLLWGITPVFSKYEITFSFSPFL